MKIPRATANWNQEMLDDPIEPIAGYDEPSISQSLSRDPSDPASNLGMETPGIADVEEDEERGLEHIVELGVEDAQDDQMRAARRRSGP